MSHSIHYGSFQGKCSQPISWMLIAGFYWSDDPINSVTAHGTERQRRSSRSGFDPTRTTPSYYNNTHIICGIKCNTKECMQTHLITVEWSHWDKTHPWKPVRNADISVYILSTVAIFNAICNSSFPPNIRNQNFDAVYRWGGDVPNIYTVQ